MLHSRHGLLRAVSNLRCKAAYSGAPALCSSMRHSVELPSAAVECRSRAALGVLVPASCVPCVPCVPEA
eukprot:scaffold41401_cov25-Phaeocystis_antarctica.AAC.2